ncbi:MAG: TrpR-related protein YerC/YecD [Clostridiales bacterium]|nr:TrpR-related protein YerC/YecD [Clostridiales bacterium]
MEGKITQEMINDLYDAFIRLSSREQCEMFFEDLFTIGELEQFAQRLRAAKLILEGKTYAKIIEDTDISSATLSRVSHCVKRGRGGYKTIIENKN